MSIITTPVTTPTFDRPAPSANTPFDRLVAAVPRRRPHRLATFAVSAVSIATAAGAVWMHARTPPTPRYETMTVTRGDVIRTVTASGTVNPVMTVQVGTYVSGVIQALHCDYNTRVKKGQLCATIDPRPYQSEVDQDAANLSTAKAQLEKDETVLTYTKLTFDRTTALVERGVVSQDTLDSAKNAYDQARAQVALDDSAIDQRRAALNAAEISLGYTNILSPVDGTVVSRNVTVGQTVAASFQTPTLFLIATDLTKMQVDVNVSEGDIGGIRVGNDAPFSVEAFTHHTFSGDVVEVRQAPQTVQNIVTYDVVVKASNPDLLLKPGMTATVRLVLDRRNNVLRISDRALRYAPGGKTNSADPPHVWLRRDGRVVRIPVSLGLDDDTFTEIVAGDLKPGDEVVLSEDANTAGQSQSPSRFFRL